MGEVIRYTEDDCLNEVRRIIRDAGFADLRRLAKAWHYWGDWEAHKHLRQLGFLLAGLGEPGIPDCCQMEDHERTDGELRLPGEEGGPTNYEAAPREGRS